MKIYYHESLLERLINIQRRDGNISSVDLSVNDFNHCLKEAQRAHYEHKRYPDFEEDGLEVIQSFTIENIMISLSESEKDEED